MTCDPGVGVTVLDARGKILFINARAADLFFGMKADLVTDRSLEDLLPSAWTRERLELFERVHSSQRPVIFRYIRRGAKLQTTIHPMAGENGDDPRFLSMTTVGTADPQQGCISDGFEVVDSELADFGPLEVLTRRELEVLALIKHGMTLDEIAKVLHRSRKTIENHRQSIGKKLGESSRVRLAQIAAHAGLEVKDAKLLRTSGRVSGRGRAPNPD